ncbi:MAG TPA: hypothetical protein VNU47_00140 [Candidatus Paceibacterota bacterium]|nr:hypothetical protein [Candidatus Paceibacterota bacterium]
MSYRTFALILHLILLGGIALPSIAFAQGFVPLTNLPGLSDFEQSPDLPAFLNSLYKICIGVAATLAVFQIMHAGIKFMTNKGSVSENEQAKDLIRGAVLGLLLVLSPVIVFGIINPKILELDLDVSRLESEIAVPEDDPTTGGTGGDTTGGTGGDSAGSWSLVGAVYRPSAEAAGQWLDQYCQNNQVPANVQDIVAERGRDVSGAVDCPIGVQGTANCNTAGKTYIARCESDSKDFRVFRDRSWANQWNPTNWFDTEWVAIPGKDKELFDRFSSICTAERGRINIESDRDFNLLTVASSGCSADERERMGEGNWMCVEARAICES